MRAAVFAALLAAMLFSAGCSGAGGGAAGSAPVAGGSADRFELGRTALRSGDPRAAIEHFRASAGSGHAGAAFSLGVLYALGQGVEHDADQALVWYRRAAELGGAEAQYNLGVKLDDGASARPDDPNTTRWLERLGRLGEPANPLRVGSDYPFGPAGLDADPAEAAVWYERAAEQAHVMAWYRLGRLHVAGRGVERDLVRAHMWLALCAELGLGDSAGWVAALAAEMTPEQLAASRALAEQWKATTPRPAPVAPRRPSGARPGAGH